MNWEDITARIREEAGKLLASRTVDVVIGFENGSLPLRATPCFVESASDTGRLVWNSFCSNNLSRHLIRPGGRVGIIAKGCDTRAIVELIKEKQLRREDVFIIGVPCRGMINVKQLRSLCPGKVISGLTETGDDLVVTGIDLQLTVGREEYLYPACKACAAMVPVIHDLLVEAEPGKSTSDGFQDVSEFASLPPGERWAHITSEMDRCIRCYACRNACPLCYCKQCFVDDTQPQWVGKGVAGSDTMFFHLMRTIHLAGRCIECGECERSCPMDIDIRMLHRKMSADVAGLYGCTPGLDAGESAPLSRFKPDDTEDFMLDPGPA